MENESLRDKIAYDIFKTSLFDRLEKDRANGSSRGIYHKTSRQRVLRELSEEAYEFTDVFLEVRKEMIGTD